MKTNGIKVLIGCEESQAVCIEFRKLGFETYSCDLLPCSGGHPEWHIQGDVLDVIDDGWDLAIFHPECTYLSVSGIHWNNRGRGWAKTNEALAFVQKLMDCKVPHWALENPVSIVSTRIRKPDQIIQPYQFGDDASKKTCLWLHNLPKLTPTDEVPGRIVNGKMRWDNQTDSGQNKLGPSEDRAKLRSKTYPGIAKALADQYGEYLLNLKK